MPQVQSPAQAGSAARLTRAIARGDHAALDEFYRRWQGPCLVIARRAAGSDESRAWDILHDAMLRVVRRVREIETDAELERWLTRVIYTVALDAARAERRRRSRERHTPHNGHTSAYEHADDHSLWLRAELKNLGGEERDLLLLRFVRGLTLDQVGRALGRSGPAAHGRIRRLLASLRANFKERDDE